MKTMKIHIKQETFNKAKKSKHREDLIESGFYNRSKSQKHKSVKDYSRKPKYKTDYFE